MELRDYQREAVDAVFAYWERAPSTPDRPASPLIVMPTGAGKSPTLGEIVRRLVQDFGCRVLIATHRAELIKQDAKAVRSVFPGVSLGIYSAGLARREIRQVTVAGIQSVARKASALGHIDVMIIDEAHLLNPSEGTQYLSTIKRLREANPDMRIVGLTATPYRLGQGFLTEGADALFTAVAYDTSVRRLIDGGYLSPVVTGYVTTSISLEDVSVRAGEFAAKDLELASDVDKVNDAVADDVVKALSSRTSALVFGTSVAHAKRLRNALQIRGVSSETITGETPREERDRIIDLFKSRALRSITSCDVLTTGFDAPVTDVIALVRPTMSPSLYVQMVGRGMRKADGKTDCLLLDYGGNIARHGPIDDVKVKPKGKGDGGDAPVKLCPKCQAMAAVSARLCLHCGYEWPPPERKANEKASNLPALSFTVPEQPPKVHEIGHIEWAKHIKNGDDEAPPTLRIDFYPPAESGSLVVPRKICSQWVCLEHQDKSLFAWKKAIDWWDKYVGCKEPETVDEAITLLDAGYMAKVVAIKTQPSKNNPKYVEVVEIMQQSASDYIDDDREDEDQAAAPVVAFDDEELPW